MLVAAKRARQINRYYHNLGEGTFDEYPPPMVETGSKNYLKIALEEIAAGQDQVPLPPSAGVTGGGLWPASFSGSPAGSPPTRPSSWSRLATTAGHSVRVVQTPRA